MHKLLRIFLVCATLTLTSIGFPTALAAQQFAYVADYLPSQVLVIDTSSNLVEARVRLGTGHPIDVAITPDGSRLYVTNYNFLRRKFEEHKGVLDDGERIVVTRNLS